MIPVRDEPSAREPMIPAGAEAPIPPRIGSYTVTGILGRGGMGIVYAGEDPKLRRPIAIKVLSPKAPLDPDGLARFEREARLLAALNHPNIATIHSLEQHEDVHLLTMELVPGATLAQRIARDPPRLAEALEIAAQIAGALEAAHDAGVIHLDLKPVNIKITPEARVKLLDFGLARASLLRAAQDRSGRGRHDAGDDDPGDAGLHESRAGPQRTRRSSQRRLGFRLRALRAGRRGIRPSRVGPRPIDSRRPWSARPTGRCSPASCRSGSAGCSSSASRRTPTSASTR